MRADLKTSLPDYDTPTVEQLRHAIDLGRARDKIRVGDPAAAPLGADEEAAGTPTSCDRLRDTCANEFGRCADQAQGRHSGLAVATITLAFSIILAAFAVAIGG